MKKLILILSIVGLLMGCYLNMADQRIEGGGGKNINYNTTIGQEFIDLKQALDSGAITQEEYDELKLKIIERYDEPVDSTAHKIMKMIFRSEATPADSTDNN